VPAPKQADIVVVKPSEIMLANAEQLFEVPSKEAVNVVANQHRESAPTAKKRRTVKRSRAPPKAKKMIRKKRASVKKK
jgi:hypothetical protein